MQVRNISVETGFVREAVHACEQAVDAIRECAHIDAIETNIPCPVVTMAQVVKCVVLRFEADGTTKAKLVLPTNGYWFCDLDPFLLSECLESRGVSLELVLRDELTGGKKYGSV